MAKTTAERIREHRGRMSELALWGLVTEVAEAVEGLPKRSVPAAVRVVMIERGFKPPKGFE